MLSCPRDTYSSAKMKSAGILLFCSVLKYRMTFYPQSWYQSVAKIVLQTNKPLSRVTRLWLTVRQSSVHFFIVVHGLVLFVRLQHFYAFRLGTSHPLKQSLLLRQENATNHPTIIMSAVLSCCFRLINHPRYSRDLPTIATSDPYTGACFPMKQLSFSQLSKPFWIGIFFANCSVKIVSFKWIILSNVNVS